MSKFKGKALYKPEGKAGEYARWACNLFNGCSNDCSYCYCKKGVLSHAMGGTTPTLKKCFKDEDDAFKQFKKEFDAHYGELRREGGVFFSFSTDPCLPETFPLTIKCVDYAVTHEVHCHILTKCVEWLKDENVQLYLREYRRNISVGFTLTGCDEEEPGAPTNALRILAMKICHNHGVKTFASIEPIVKLGSSLEMISKTKDVCDLYKIGLMSGVKKDYYQTNEVVSFVMLVNGQLQGRNANVYWKESIRQRLGKAGYDSYLQTENCVEHDYDVLA